MINVKNSRTILPPNQKVVLFEPPDVSETIERLYTVEAYDMALIARRQRPENRLEFSVQLCCLWYPDRTLLGLGPIDMDGRM